MKTRDGKYHQEFCKIRNKVRPLTRKGELEYEKSIAIQAKSNPKKLWNYVRSKTKVKTAISDLDYNAQSGQINLMKTRHTYWEKIPQRITREPDGGIPKLDDRLTTGFFNNVDNKREIQKSLENLKINKFPGVDGLHPRVLNVLDNETTNRSHENIATSISVT